MKAVSQSCDPSVFYPDISVDVEKFVAGMVHIEPGLEGKEAGVAQQVQGSEVYIPQVQYVTGMRSV